MAENPIRKEDIIDGEAIIAELKEIIGLLKNDFVNALDAIKKSAKEYSEVLKTANPASDEGRQKIKQITTETESLAQETNQLTESQKKLLDIENKIQATFDESYKEEVRLRNALRDRNKEVADEVKMEGLADGSVTKLRLQLAALKKAYYDADPGKRGGMVDGVNKLQKEVTKAEKAIGVHSRGVGDYKNNIISATKELGLFAGGIGLAVAGLNNIKEAMLGTELGTKFKAAFAELKTTFFQTLGFGAGSSKSISNAALVLSATKELDRLRIEDREENKKNAEDQTKIVLLRLQSAKASKDSAEQVKLLTEAEKLEDAIITRKKEHLTAEIAAYQLLAIARPKDTKLLDTLNAKEIELVNLEGERSVRLASKLQAARDKELKDQEKSVEDKKKLDKDAYDNYIAYTKAEQEAKKKEYDYIYELAMKEYELKLKLDQEAAENWKKYNKDKEDATRAEYDWIFQYAMNEMEAEKKKKEENEEDWRRKVMETLQMVQNISEGFFQTKMNQLDRERNKELNNKNLTEAQKEEINKKYANKEKDMAKKKILMNTALGVMQIWASSGVWWWKLIQSAAVLIEGAWAYNQADAQQFGEGGDIKGKSHNQGGTMIEAEGGEYVVKKKSTAKYHDLIEAINKDNPMAIAEEIRSRNFHTVWGGVSTQLSEVSRQDPYTRKMYELMKNDIKVYTDSNGDTVINYPDGSKRIVRKYTA